jgi:glycosyltransferase involved in cell wall biosynthesis
MGGSLDERSTGQTQERGNMRVIALIATYNEGRFIAHCLDHLHRNGVESYVIDNESTDDTFEKVSRFKARGLLGAESFPRLGRYRWGDMLRRKEELAMELDADWFIHLDPDEFRLPPSWSPTLAGALAEVSRRGFNAVNFTEFAFVPTREQPDHDHDHFQQTMRWYYPFEPHPHYRLNAWRKQSHRVGLASRGGHTIRFPGLRAFPESFPMRHYIFVSREHALAKYGNRAYEPREVLLGWHGWRVMKPGTEFPLPSQSELREYTDDKSLDPRNPLTRHFIEDVFSE